jgi:hypothetical protein
MHSDVCKGQASKAMHPNQIKRGQGRKGLVTKDLAGPFEPLRNLDAKGIVDRSRRFAMVKKTFTSRRPRPLKRKLTHGFGSTSKNMDRV